jgi:hypothetical protein
VVCPDGARIWMLIGACSNNAWKRVSGMLADSDSKNVRCEVEDKANSR